MQLKFLKNQTLIKGAFLGLWVLLVAGVAFLLWRGEVDQKRDGKPLAILKEAQGLVQSRADDIVVWTSISKNHRFFEGDRVATGSNSRARIEFIGGRVVEIGENTQIQITAIQGDNNLSFIVTLLKGSLTAKAITTQKKSQGVFTVKAGQKNFSLSARNDEVGVFKAAEKEKVSVFTLKQDGHVLVNKPKPVTQPTPTPTPEEIKEPEPVKEEIAAVKKPEPPPAPKIVLSAKGFEPKVANLENGDILWTRASLKDNSANLKLPIDVQPPQSAPSGSKWMPLVELGAPSKNAGQGVIITGDETFKTQHLSVPLNKIRAGAEEKMVNNVSELVVNIREGARLSGAKGGIDKSFLPGTRTIRLRSLKDVAPGPVSVLSSDFESPAKEGEWIRQSKNTGEDVKNYQVNLLSNTDLLAMLPVLRRSQAFSVERGTDFANDSGIFLIKNGRLVAQLKGRKEWTPKVLRRMMIVFEADLAFQGSASAMFDTKGKSPDDVSKWVKESVASQKTVYLFDGQRLYPVNKQFIEKNPEVTTFVTANAKAIFKENVTVLAVNTGEKL